MNNKLRKEVEEKASIIESIRKDYFIYNIQQDKYTNLFPLLEKIINEAIIKEDEMSKKYYVFYHGQKREFLLFYDLLSLFFKLYYKKELKDFFMLRIPDNNKELYDNITIFWEKNKEIFDNGIGDHHKNMREALLSVTPTLLNGKIGESALDFFFQHNNPEGDSSIIRDIFKCFDIESLFIKYENKLEEVIKCLIKNEPNGTGVLLQIFIPCTEVDNIVYDAAPGGYRLTELASQSIKESDSFYKKSNKIEEFNAIREYEKQYRILIENNVFLRPSENNDVKMFRYCNEETESMKKYKKLFNEIAKELTKKVEEKTIKKFLESHAILSNPFEPGQLATSLTLLKAKLLSLAKSLKNQVPE
jgi:hypothetical protein